jgi:hypothetical protein
MQEVSSLNLVPETSYPDRVFVGFLSSGKCRDSTASFHILSNSLITLIDAT